MYNEHIPQDIPSCKEWLFTTVDCKSLARFARVRLLRHTLQISLLISRKQWPVLQSISHAEQE